MRRCLGRNLISASILEPEPGMRPSSGLSTPIFKAARATRNCVRRTAAKNPGGSPTGGWATKWMVPGRWVTRAPRTTASLRLEAAKLMKWTDPNIKLIAAGSSNYNADWVGWNRTVLQNLKNHMDYLSLHLYVGNRNNDYYEFLTSSIDLNEKTKIGEGLIQAALVDNPRRRSIYIAWDEWNVWYRARGPQQRGRNILEEKYNLEDALVIATFLNSFVNNAHIVKMANMAQLVNVIAPIFTNDKELYLQTIYYPLQLFATHSRGKALNVFVDSPTYKTQKYAAVPYLDVSAAYDNGTLVLNVVNRHRDQPIEVEVQSQKGNFSGTFEVAEVNGPDIKAENTFGSTKVQTARKTISANGDRFVSQFPAHSYTMIKGALR